MTTIATADLHMAASRRDSYRWRFLEETLPAMVEEHRARRVLVLGDLTEAKSGHSAELVNRLVDALAALAERAPVYLLRGNHDFVSEDSPFFKFSRHLPRVRWINEPTGLRLRGLGSCLFLPFSRNPGADWGMVRLNAYDWYFCHQAFSGARGENGRAVEGTSRDIFPRGARVVAGDIHGPQRVGCVTYAGAPYLIDFGDSYAPRVLLLAGSEIRSVPVPGPQKRLITATPRDLELRADLLDVAPGDVVKIRVDLPAGSDASRAEVRALAHRWAEAAGVDLYAVEIVAPRAAPSRGDRDRSRASDADLVRAYAKKMKQGKTAIAVGMKIAEEVV